MNQVRAVFTRMSQQGGGGVPQGSPTGVYALIVGGLGVYGAYNSLITIQPGHRGIVYNRFGGLDDRHLLREGLNLVIPWFQRAIVFDVRTRPQPIDTNSGSKDLQMVTISLRVLFKPDPNQLGFIYRRLGKDYDSRVLPSIVNEITKAVVAQYNAAELLTKREAVSKQVRELLTKRSGDFHILLDDVAIVDLYFSREFTAAVEAKQVAQQDSERAKYIVDRALQEKKSIIIRAEGEARSAELIGNAIKKNPAFLQLRKIEASKDIAMTIASSGNKVYLDSDTLMINTLGETSLTK
ncbi:band 7 family-domain-containing protein [Ochromonadaceae sp. CCMP2298]|nr:band 7 family-domain-containing protein [Ochromonadaceae sp. CCMP2298]|mmetsp:Transcript_7343/g.16071  ORF Transcript_7343/g.16071 Transcript_7343/m.16071 type:complete len:295 (+) Transcript_7343:53-937(+)